MRNTVYLVLILLITCTFFTKLFFPEPKIFFTPENIRGDVWYLYYPVKDFLSDSLKNGKLPLWSKNVGTGYPILAEGQVGTFNIFNFILFGAFSTWFAFNISYVLIIFLAFLGSYLFFKKNGISQYSSLLASFSFSFGGYFMGHTMHFNMIQAASFMPWVFLAAQNVLEKANSKNILILIFIVSQMIFTGHMQIVFITFIGIFIYFIISQYRNTPNLLLNKLIVLLIIIFFALLISGIQLLPTAELYASSVRQLAIDANAVLASSFNWKDFMNLVIPSPSGIALEKMGYVGLIPILFVMFTIFKKKRNTFEIFFIALGLISSILLLGNNSPFLFLFYFPPFSLFRAQSRFLLLFSFSICGLFAINLDYILQLLRKRKNKFLVTFLTLSVFIFILFDMYKYGYAINPVIPVKEAIKKPETASYIPQNSRIFIHYSHNVDYFNYFKIYGTKEMFPYIYFRNGLEEDSNLTFKIANLRAYFVYPTVREYFYESSINTPLVNAAAAEYIISTASLNGYSGIDLVKRIDPPKTNLPYYYVYKNNNFLPRVRFVSNYEVQEFKPELYRESANAKIQFINSSYDFGNSVILERDLNKTFAVLGRKDIAVIKDKDTELILKTNTDKEGLLIVADSYYPGWHAEINGNRTVILPANVNQRAIIVPAGENTIRFYFRPVSFIVGTAISIISFVLLIYILKKGVLRMRS